MPCSHRRTGPPRQRAHKRNVPLTSTSEIWHLDGQDVEITHPDKRYWPKEGYTKRQLLNYYRDMAPVMLPYFKDRPVTLHLFPRGIEDFSYYRRDTPDEAPSWLRHVDYETENDPHLVRLPLIDNTAGLIWFANQGSIEFHLWASRASSLGQPDWAIFDLDPGDQVGFTQVLEATLRLRDALASQGIEGYPKTSGARGVHVYVPIDPGLDYEDVRAWVKDIGKAMAANHPELFAIARGSTHKGTHVTIDYAQNSIGHNTIAPYSVRALPMAPVSMPLSWDAIDDGALRPTDFTLLTAHRHIERVGDAFSRLIKGHRST